MTNKVYQISLYVPQTHSELVKQAMFEAGAGRLGNYDCCSWQSLGQGQFRPLQGSNPFLGNENKLEKVDELKIEMICDSNHLKLAIKALKSSHPYETPAYTIIELKNH